MRSLPAGWPDPSEPDQTTPTVYLHLVDSVWPPAAGDLAAGYVECGSWHIDRDLVGSLLPGQVRAPSGFSVATGGVSIPQPDGVRLAPWRAGDRRVVPPASVELIASYDGPTGATAFVLGTFRVAPISGRVSEPSLMFDLVEEWSALKRPNTVQQYDDHNPLHVPGAYSSTPYDPARIVEQIAADAGFTVSVSDFGTSIRSIYFPPELSAMECLQQIVSSNMGAAFVAADGSIKVLSYDQLVGADTVVQDLDVLTDFADLEWVIDQSEACDRVEVRFTTPSYRGLDYGDVTDGDQRPNAAWVAAETLSIPAGGSRDYVVDPGFATFTRPGSRAVSGNTAANGSGSIVPLMWDGIDQGSVRYRSSGRIEFTLVNSSGGTLYLVEGDGQPSFLQTDWRDSSTSDAGSVLAWGADEYGAVNPLSVDFGRLVQTVADAQVLLDRIVSRVRYARWRINSVAVRPDIRREIGDLVWVNFPEEGLSAKALVTSVSVAGEPGGISQTVDLAILRPLIRDFDEAWEAALPGATVADFNALWAGKTIADFNFNPLNT